MNFEKILVTGGAGFIGSNFIRQYLEKHAETQIVNLDKLTYCGRKESLQDIENNPETKNRYTFIKGDICNKKIVEQAMHNCDAVINFAAESHVDRSIQDPTQFIQTDVFGTFVLLEQARKQNVKKFLQISTDEVYGQIKEGSFTEESLLMPRNPYSASKAGADRLAYSFFATYDLPVIITRSSNQFGPYQYPEKVIPLFVTNLLQGKKVPVYGQGKQIRDWLYVLDNCEALELCLHQGRNGEVYNIGGGNEIENIELTQMILEELGQGKEMIQFVQDRLGHDFRYSLDCTKIQKELGWKPKHEFARALHSTIEWYKNNSHWWKNSVK
ncbi:MAG: dTDP-glucose 4,6-dehydratase [Candidatus Diapherotrites archaeon]|nr:dTDP-glucose 4,6-dehydratase [Candidatus Diapherotrites archaeon]